MGEITSPAALERAGFWFLRHGETDWNARNLSQGNVDIELNETGIRQAHEAAARLLNRGIVSIVSSPLSRARVTAEVAAAALGLGVAFDEGLREVAFGEQEGLPMGDWYDDWIAGSYTPAGAEPFADLRARAIAAINRALLFPGPVLVVAHGGLFRALRAAMGLKPNVRTANAVPIYCEPPPAGDTVWTLNPVS